MSTELLKTQRWWSGYEPTAPERERVAQLASYGLPHELISECVRYKDRTLPLEVFETIFTHDMQRGLALSAEKVARNFLAMCTIEPVDNVPNRDVIRACVKWLSANCGWGKRTAASGVVLMDDPNVHDQPS